MKAKNPRITLLGNNAGRNLGDAAIMSSILEGFSKELPEVEFYVPSVKPKWTRKHYGESYNVRAINVMPWTGSIRLLGLPTLWCLAKSDVALICDGIIFGKKLFNPTFNYLITLIFLVPWAKLVNCKIVCFSCGIGPFPSWISRVFAKWVINGSDLVIMREHDSRKLAEELGVKKDIEVTGDAAFLNPVAPVSRALEILNQEKVDSTQPIFGINVNSYFDSWLGKDERLSDKDGFLQILADGILRTKKLLGVDFQCLVFSTHPMDEPVCESLAKSVNGTVINNSKYLSHDIQAVMQRCELFLGMRFHSLVLSSAVEVPIVGLIYMPKVKGYFRLLDCENYGLELAQITSENLAQTLTKAWKEKNELRQKQKKIIDGLKRGAENAVRSVVRKFFGTINS